MQQVLHHVRTIHVSISSLMAADESNVMAVGRRGGGRTQEVYIPVCACMCVTQEWVTAVKTG